VVATQKVGVSDIRDLLAVNGLRCNVSATLVIAVNLAGKKRKSFTMKKQNQTVSFSGGKDSTAMLLMMLEKNEPIHSIIFCDGGWEFPQMLDHIDKVEKYVGMEIVRVSPAVNFTYSLLERKVNPRDKNKEAVYGYGWPSQMRRWCTREKISAIDKYRNTIPNPVACIGMAYDEFLRLNSKESQKAKYEIRYPLVEYEVTEADALEYCYQKGFYWDGLYTKFKRVSCFCCPLQTLGELRKLRKHYPELWNQMLEWESIMPEHNFGFKEHKTVHDLEKRFEYEDRQEVLPL